ncbi:rod shape-determining protein MreC [Burkholderia cepacia]|uniref:Cell shape-determining protein MreC n=1 Tax=Burkholderia cepacia GG4 TaxID=1009846 RepID=A0A9W3JY28_BURCE|nr:rod shape-determining protein MreC [Burkholderia cepacia]AFQ46775.1 rod shape-determining protein MreC [Burkholderia cepacia GG4]
MEYSPPPLFKQGPPALARLFFFVALAIALLVSDARFSTLEIVRGVLGTVLYPLQRAALVPRDLFMGAADIAVTGASLRHENDALRKRNLQLSTQANQAAVLTQENGHLRAVLELRQHIATQSTPVEIQYDTSDPFTQKIVIGQGSQQGIQNGAPVVSEDGVVGQITRVFPLQAEVTLITDRDLAIPVQVLRTGLRSVIYGTPKGDALDLRFVPTSSDLVVGDELVTSGLDGVYPPGTAVGGKGDDSEFGLGFGKLLYYTLALNKAVGDSNALDVVAAPAGSDAWVLDGAGLMANGSARKSFSESGNTAPGAYKTISADLTVTPTINKLPELDLSNGGVALDGSATLELTYL